MFFRELKKYLSVSKVTWQRALTYRFTIFSYRIGEILELIVVILMWTAIFGDQEVVKGYTLQEMITYILVGNIIDVIVRNWLADMVSREIRDGQLSQYLVKPVNYLRYMFFREIGRISVALFMSLASQLFVIVFFLNKFIFNTDWRYLSVIMVMIIFAFISELLISFLIGLVSFWVDEVAGLYSTISRLRKFISGSYFPLDLLSAWVVNIAFLLPFAYSFFVPAQLYLKKISLTAGLQGLCVQVVWIILLYGIIRVVWKRGIRHYEGVGI